MSEGMGEMALFLFQGSIKSRQGWQIVATWLQPVVDGKIAGSHPEAIYTGTTLIDIEGVPDGAERRSLYRTGLLMKPDCNCD
jgi:hypothetical protein